MHALRRAVARLLPFFWGRRRTANRRTRPQHVSPAFHLTQWSMQVRADEASGWVVAQVTDLETGVTYLCKGATAQAAVDSLKQHHAIDLGMVLTGVTITPRLRAPERSEYRTAP